MSGRRWTKCKWTFRQGHSYPNRAHLSPFNFIIAAPTTSIMRIRAYNDNLSPIKLDELFQCCAF
eukprot:3750352-Pleurochrysis_carterae.AAC.2